MCVSFLICKLNVETFGPMRVSLYYNKTTSQSENLRHWTNEVRSRIDSIIKTTTTIIVFLHRVGLTDIFIITANWVEKKNQVYHFII